MANYRRWMFLPTGGQSSIPEKRGDRETRGKWPTGPRRLVPLGSLVLVWLAGCCPLEIGAAEPRGTGSQVPDSAGVRRAMIIVGHPGDAEHEGLYAAVLEALTITLTTRCRFPADQVLLWCGTKPREARPPSQGVCRGPATWEAIQAGVRELREQLTPQDALWVFVIGHAHFDGRRVFFNLPGPDPDAEQFGKLFHGIACREQVFFITTPASGYATKFLSQKDRVVITATEADREVNATIFPVLLAEVLSNPPPAKEFDSDGDGRITLLDLYVTVSRRVLQAYAEAKNIPTEHAQLDDNNDGRGTEVQLDYLEAELGGRAQPGVRRSIKPGVDGAVALSIDLKEYFGDKPPAEPASQEAPTSPQPETKQPAPSDTQGTRNDPAGQKPSP